MKQSIFPKQSFTPLFYLFISVLLNLIISQLASAQAQTADSIEIRKIIAFDREAWKEYNVEKAIKYYADDIYWINAFGVEKHGKADVKAFLTSLFASPNFTSLKLDKPDTFKGMRMISPTVAWVHVYSERSGQRAPSGQLMAPRKTHVFYILNKQKSGWRIAFHQIMDARQSMT